MLSTGTAGKELGRLAVCYSRRSFSSQPAQAPAPLAQSRFAVQDNTVPGVLWLRVVHVFWIREEFPSAKGVNKKNEGDRSWNEAIESDFSRRACSGEVASEKVC